MSLLSVLFIGANGVEKRFSQRKESPGADVYFLAIRLIRRVFTNAVIPQKIKMHHKLI